MGSDARLEGALPCPAGELETATPRMAKKAYHQRPRTLRHWWYCYEGVWWSEKIDVRLLDLFLCPT
jgi:hypothetical protein